MVNLDGIMVAIVVNYSWRPSPVRPPREPSIAVDDSRMHSRYGIWQGPITQLTPDTW